MHIVKRAYLKNGFEYKVGSFLKMLNGEDQLTKRQYMHATANATISATFTTTTTTVVTSTTVATSTTTSVATNCKAKSINTEITNVYKYTGYQKDLSAIS